MLRGPKRSLSEERLPEAPLTDSRPFKPEKSKLPPLGVNDHDEEAFVEALFKNVMKAIKEKAEKKHSRRRAQDAQ